MDRPGAPSSRQRFFVHAGLPKTGTTFVQDVLHGSPDALEAQGLALVPSRRHDHFDLALQLRGMLRGFDTPEAHGALDRFVEQMGAQTCDAGLLTHESLAPASHETIETLLAVLRDHEVHLLLTVRDLGRQVPSAWQQAIQGRRTLEYAAFLQAVTSRAEQAADFWRNQDVAAVLQRWSVHLPREQIHVVVCPPAGSPPSLLLERFCSVLDVDPDLLEPAPPSVNLSLGQVQAELLRRVNLALGDRLPHSRAGYRRVGKTFLAGKVLQPQQGERAHLPRELRPWVEEVTSGWVDLLTNGGFDVVGDLGELRTADASYADTLTVPDEAQLLDAAVTALADILVLRDGELDERAESRRELRRLRAQVRELEQPSRPDPTTSPRSPLLQAVSRAGRAAGRRRAPR